MRDIRYQIAVNRQPDNALTAEIAEIEVTQTIDGPTTGRLRFAVDICNEDFSLLDDERLNPGQPDTEMTVIATLNDQQHVLMHGIITERQAKFVEGGPGSYLELKLTDRRAVMARTQQNRAHTGTVAEIVAGIVTGGEPESYGFEADVANTSIEYEENTNTLNQTEDDLTFIEQLAGRNGSRFWIDWELRTGLAGFDVVETAHFKPSPPRPSTNFLGINIPVNLPIPIPLAPSQHPPLTLNTGDGCSSLSSFEVNANNEAPNQSGEVLRIASDGILDETEVVGSSENLLGGTVANVRAITRRVMSAGSAQEAEVRNQAALNDAAFSIKASAETSVQALNAILSAHQTVKVEGAGRTNSGQYFLSSVTHAIDPSAHLMRLEMMRNASGAST